MSRVSWDNGFSLDGNVLDPGITVVIPTIGRATAGDAVNSALNQTLRPAAVVLAVDTAHEGAATTRQEALVSVRTHWVAFLDDDDEMKPEHLKTLMDWAVAERADYVYSWFDTEPVGCDPFPPNHETDAFDPDNPILTTITTLVRTDLAQYVGFSGTEEDYRFELGCLAAGAVISHAPGRTWVWHHHGKNTSGRGDRW